MKPLTLFLAGLAALPLSSLAAQTVGPAMAKPDEQVRFENFNASNGTYDGRLLVTGEPCKGGYFAVGLPFKGVKTQDEARAQVKDQLAVVERDYNRQAAPCRPKP